MKILMLLVLILPSSLCFADWGMNFYRFQCVPELGRIYFDTFYIPNPDEYGKIDYFGKNDKVFKKLAAKHEIYSIDAGTREFDCTLGNSKLHILIAMYGPTSQGELVGRITLNTGNNRLIDQLLIFSYDGNSPEVKAFEITATENSNLIGSFDVIGASGHKDFTFSHKLLGEVPVTDAMVHIEAEKHP